ncbi:acyl-CoA dehydrogenase family protein [Chloroflexota bacterium]
MEPELSEEHRMFQTAIRAFTEKEVAPLVKEAEDTETFPAGILRQMGKLGYLCPGYPEEYGGGGLGKVGDCIMAEEMSRVCVGIATGIIVQSGLATYALYAHGSEEQQQQYLIPACKGEKIASFGLTEPNAGSDASAIETTAQKSGDHYVINGTKIYITNSPVCDYVLVAAYTDKSKGTRCISTFVVERDTPGFSVNKMDKLGVHSAATGELVFEDCRIPAQNLVGEEGSGYKYMLEALNGARISTAARSVGTAQAALDASLEYAKQRVQFGQPIGRNQAIAFRLATMATQITAARALTYQVAKAYDQGNQCRLEGSMAKLFGAEVAVRAAEDAMRIHGGAGYLKESVVQRYFRDAILGISVEGTAEIQQLMIARELGLFG